MSFEHTVQGFSTGPREHVRNAREKKNKKQKTHEMPGRGRAFGVYHNDGATWCAKKNTQDRGHHQERSPPPTTRDPPAVHSPRVIHENLPYNDLSREQPSVFHINAKPFHT